MAFEGEPQPCEASHHYKRSKSRPKSTNSLINNVNLEFFSLLRLHFIFLLESQVHHRLVLVQSIDIRKMTAQLVDCFHDPPELESNSDVAGTGVRKALAFEHITFDVNQLAWYHVDTVRF